MKYIRQSLLFVTLSPIIILFLISASNIQNKSSLRLLTWQTPKQYLGTFIAIGTSIGFITSFSSVYLFSNSSNTNIKRKYVVANKKDEDLYSKDDIDSINMSYEPTNDLGIYNNDEYIERDPREPLPTISVAYKVKKVSNSSLKSKRAYKNNIKSDNSDIENQPRSNRDYQSYNKKNSSDDWSNSNYEEW